MFKYLLAVLGKWGASPTPRHFFLFFCGAERGGLTPKKSRLLWSRVEKGEGDSIMDSVVAAGLEEEEKRGGGEKLSLPAS